MLFIQLIYSLIIEVDMMKEVVNDSISRIKHESEKWMVTMVSFDIVECKMRIDPCEFFIDQNTEDQCKMLIFIEDHTRIQQNHLLFNLSVYPQYDTANILRSSTFQFKKANLGDFKMTYIPSSIVALLIKINLIYKNLIKISGVELSKSYYDSFKNYVQMCTFHKRECLDFSLYRLKCDYQVFLEDVIVKVNNAHGLNIQKEKIIELINNLFLDEEFEINESYDVVKTDVDRLSYVIYDSTNCKKLIDDLIMTLTGKHFIFQMI